MLKQYFKMGHARESKIRGNDDLLIQWINLNILVVSFDNIFVTRIMR